MRCSFQKRGASSTCAYPCGALPLPLAISVLLVPYFTGDAAWHRVLFVRCCCCCGRTMTCSVTCGVARCYDALCHRCCLKRGSSTGHCGAGPRTGAHHFRACGSVNGDVCRCGHCCSTMCCSLTECARDACSSCVVGSWASAWRVRFSIALCFRYASAGVLSGVRARHYWRNWAEVSCVDVSCHHCCSTSSWMGGRSAPSSRTGRVACGEA